jgi:hypothetical protein
MAVVLRYEAMSSVVSEQGAFDALRPSDRLASCCDESVSFAVAQDWWLKRKAKRSVVLNLFSVISAAPGAPMIEEAEMAMVCI